MLDRFLGRNGKAELFVNRFGRSQRLYGDAEMVDVKR